MKRRSSVAALLGLVVGIGVLCEGASSASAYPYFQFSSGTERCNLCHLAPAGGGLLTDWGREESADTLSRGGNGAFLHGLFELPEALSLGGDVRVAALVNDTGASEGATFAAFPMQVDLAAAARFDAWTVGGNVGLRGSAREADLSESSNRAEAGPLSRLISREHHVTWQKDDTGPYVRLGRFYAPFGLRLPDHTSYVRRYTGFNLLEETYGLSGGWIAGRRELHVTGFVTDELRWAPQRAYGATAMGEWRTDASTFGGSARVAVGELDLRATGGLFFKHWMEGPKLLWMAEVDATWQQFAEVDDAARWQLAAYVGPVWIPTTGVYTGVAYELFDEDLRVRDVERHAASVWVSILPRAHVELMLSARGQVIGTTDRAFNTMLQVHYYL